VKQAFFNLAIVLGAIITSSTAFAQSVSSDNIQFLQHELELLEDRSDQLADSIRVENLNQIALYQSSSSLGQALATLITAEAIAIKSGIIDLIAVTHYNRGQVYEQHGDFAKSEKSYLIWYNVRKDQTTRKYRWAMTGMREFYSRHLQFEKLEIIDSEWVQLLDRQMSNGEEPLYGYEGSMLAIVDNLVRLGEYYKAETYFIHLLENDASSVDWLQGHMFYFRIENKFLDLGDFETLNDWYSRWFLALAKYNDNSLDAVKTMSIVSGHLKYEPRLAAQIIENLFQISREINHPEANTNFLSFWIPILNKTVASNTANQVKSPTSDRVIQHCITFNTRAALLLTNDTDKQKEYLQSIKMATDAIEFIDGMDKAFFDKFLTVTISEAANKKVAKSLKKTQKKYQSLLI
jgi:tetratricopeptide (TPR) repeat protein